MNQFENRVDAGRRLGEALLSLRGSDSVVLGLPRGGVPVAAKVAEVLNLPLDVLIVRKLGLPTHPEVAMGAIGEGGVRVLDPQLIALAGVSEAQVDAVEAAETQVLEARLARFRRGHGPIDLAGRTALIVDDGIATGSTARVACLVARKLGASRVIVAAPVGSREAVDALDAADEVVCLLIPPQFYAVGAHYRDFTATTEDEVDDLLDQAAERMQRPRPQRSGTP
jgi:putative phosphoribosyl transferase